MTDTSLTGQRALVLGGSVFVGRRLVEILVERGADVAVLNRGHTPTALPVSTERIAADRTDADQMRSALGGRQWDMVFDVSGFVMAAGGSDVDLLLDLLDGNTGAYVFVSSIMAYDQSAVGRFPWTEDQPTNSGGASSYGGFKALAERAVLERHVSSGFPGCAVRPAAIYGPLNNIYDMEAAMFLRLLQRRPVLVPHEGLVVGSYGHVDDLCAAMIVAATHPAARGQVFNVTTDSLDVNCYVAALAEVVGVPAEVVFVPRSMTDELAAGDGPAVFGHLFKARHHAALSTTKIASALGVEPQIGFLDGHRQTFEWFLAQGWDRLTEPLADPVWRSTWDFAAEATVAERIRRG